MRTGGARARSGCGGVADGVDDRGGGEQAGDDRQADRGADADERDQGEREQRADDRAEVVHRPLEPVGAAVGLGGDDVGQQRVAGGYPEPARGPGAGAQHADLPGAGGGADRADSTAVVV